MKLIIAEKPSVARRITSGEQRRGEGEICLLLGNTAQSALMALCNRKATSKSADRIEISRISFARLH